MSVYIIAQISIHDRHLFGGRDADGRVPFRPCPRGTYLRSSAVVSQNARSETSLSPAAFAL